MKPRLFLYSFRLLLLLCHLLAFGALRRLSAFNFNVSEYPQAIVASSLTAPAPAPAPAPADSDSNDPYYCFYLTPSPPLERFIEPLTFPPVLDVSNGQPVTIGAYKITQKLHRDLPNTTLYAFGTSQETATFPGPTLMARRYVPAYVRWENHIPDEYHFLPLTNIDWARPRRGGVPLVVHIHGAEVPSIYDGNPDAWITPMNETGPAYVTQDHVYPNRQIPTQLWYHDHTFGITRLNVLAGLSGLYFIRPAEPEESMLNLPDGLPLFLKDWKFFPNGSLRVDGPHSFNPSRWCPEWFDTWLVNGKVWPFLRVFAKPYRLRILNACNGRYVGVYFSHGSQNLTFLQIGTGGGFLDEPRSLDNYLLFPGDRIDVVVDFSGLESGAEVILGNSPQPLDGNDYPRAYAFTSLIMKFIVVEDGGIEEGIITDPDYMERLQRRTAKANENKVHMITQPVRQVRTISMGIYYLRNGRGAGFIFGNNETWHDPVSIDPVVGSTEIWEFINLSGSPHPVHIHLIQFQVLNQQRIDGESYTNNQCSTSIAYPKNGTCFLDYPESPSPDQQGWKDVVASWDNYLLRILLHFTTREGQPFSFDPTQGPGYLFHCHVLQHEDHLLMRPFRLRHEEANSY